jgi:S-adenosylmethionine synthetase
VNIDTFGTNTVPETAIMKAVRKVFDLTPKGIINALDLRKPIYSATSSYGHFGRAPKKNGKGTLFTWERLDRVADLKKEIHGK